MVLFNCLSVYPPSAINDDDRTQKNDAIQKCSDFPPQSCAFDFVNLPASCEKGRFKGLFCRYPGRSIFGSRLKPYSQVIGCSSGWRSRRVEHVRRLGTFILCASLASAKGGALDPMLHCRSLVAGRGLAPTRTLARSPAGQSQVFASLTSRSSGDKSSAVISVLFKLTIQNLEDHAHRKWIYLARTR